MAFSSRKKPVSRHVHDLPRLIEHQNTLMQLPPRLYRIWKKNPRELFYHNRVHYPHRSLQPGESFRVFGYSQKSYESFRVTIRSMNRKEMAGTDEKYVIEPKRIRGLGSFLEVMRTTK